MPKLQSNDARINEYRRMDGATHAMRAASDMTLLDHELVDSEETATE